MESRNKPLKISFFTQKGGVGKSTMTTLLASVLHYRLGYNVMVMDCDYPQHSLVHMRERDKKTVMQNDYHRRAAIRQFESINKKAYPVFKCKAHEAQDEAATMMESLPVVPDVVFFDLPGTVNTPGVLTTLMGLDFIFSPITADRLVVESTLSFTKGFLALPEKEKINADQEIYLFWNQVDGREKTALYDAYEKVTGELGLTVMQTRIMDSKRFRKETEATGSYIFRSSLLPAEIPLLTATRMDRFISELLKIVHL